VVLRKKSRRERDLPDWRMGMLFFSLSYAYAPDVTLVSAGLKRLKMPEDRIILGQHPNMDCMYRTKDGRTPGICQNARVTCMWLKETTVAWLLMPHAGFHWALRLTAPGYICIVTC
jgi:hypothetical protein